VKRKVRTVFVDRIKEIVELALHNAYFVKRLRNAIRADKINTDYSPFLFVYAAQM